jgi:hypothetical protein
VTVGIDPYLLCFPFGIGLAYQASGSRFGKEDMHSRSLRSGQEFGDSVPDAPVKKGMHIFFTLRSVPSVATQIGCVDTDGPGHAPL